MESIFMKFTKDQPNKTHEHNILDGYETQGRETPLKIYLLYIFYINYP